MLTQVKTTQRRLIRPAALLGAGLLTASLTLTGCGGDGDIEAYCDTLSSTKDDIEGLEAGDPGAFETAFDAFDQLAEQAPDEVADDWETMQEGVQKIEAAFDEAGLELDELDEVMSGQVPEGVDMAKLEEMGSTLEELDSEEFNEASDAIEQHAEEECDVTLGE